MKVHGESIDDLERESDTPPPSFNNILESESLAEATLSPSHSLLDGDVFDAEASHQSFLEALRQWRGETAPPPAAPSTLPPKQPSSSPFKKQPQLPTSSVGTSNSTISSETNTFFQQTTSPPSEDSIKFEFKSTSELSYFDKLRLQKGLVSPREETVEASTMHPSLSPADKDQRCEIVVNGAESEEIEDEWDSNDEQAFLEIVSKKDDKANILESNSVAREEESQDGGQESHEPAWVLVMQDITGMEDEVIMESLDAGIMVECIPTTRLRVILPEDED
jgi:hypothetical protein